MNIILSTGILIFTGYIFGEIAHKIKLPKISGYILAGILLNPDLSGILSQDFVNNTDPLIMGIVIGATLFHEIPGPVISKVSLKKAGEIKQ